jgi:hypothetical protein
MRLTTHLWSLPRVAASRAAGIIIAMRSPYRIARTRNSVRPTLRLIGGLMLSRTAKTGFLTCTAFLGAVMPAMSQVGMPTGTFNLRVTHGSFVLNTGVTVPADLSITDGDPEDFVQIGTIGSDPLILKMVVDGSPDFRMLHLFLDVPQNLGNVYSSGGTSLFDPLDLSPIDVEITGMSFTDTTSVIPVVPNLDYFMTAFLRDTNTSTGGRFYMMPDGTYIGPGVFSPEPQVQVGGNFFNDANTAEYQFTMMSYEDPTASWRWGNIPSPSGRDVLAADGGIIPGDGRVFELGLSIGFIGTPEPGTLALLVPGMVLIMWPPKRGIQQRISAN